MKVIIVGAGLGGLTLGNLLHASNKNIHFQIYERDADSSSRSQGYSISMKEPGGLVPLRRLGLYEDTLKFSSVIEKFSFITPAGKPLLTLQENPGSPQTLRVPRHELRSLLLRNIEKQVAFDVPCLGFTERDGKPVVSLADGREESADLLVACDGVNSAIRQQMIGDSPRYLGMSSISGVISVAQDYPLLAGGSVMVIGNGVALFLLKEDGAVAWSLSLRAQKGELDGISRSVLKERAVAATQHWLSPIPEFVQQTDPEALIIRGYYDKDPLTFAHQGKVVLLGDAAHPMSPFRGEGANMAMLDALSLADLLTQVQPESGDAMIARWESEMLTRTRKAVLESRRAAVEMHDANALSVAFRNTKWRLFDKLLSLAAQGQQTRARRALNGSGNIRPSQ